MLKKIIVSLVVFSLTGCSVYMAAAGNNGVDPMVLSKCQNRACLIGNGAVPVSEKKNRDGDLVSETFTAKKPSGSAARALMHGVLDVGTCGIWEVVGTPMEGIERHQDHYGIKVFYKADGETIKSAQLSG